MTDKKLNKRQEVILLNIEFGKTYAMAEIAKFFVERNKTSLATLRRDLKELSNIGFLEQGGKLKNTTYKITTLGMLLNPINAHDYGAIEVDKRKAYPGDKSRVQG